MSSSTADIVNPAALARPESVRVWPMACVALIQVALVALWLTPSVNNLTRFIVMMAGPLACGVLFILTLLFASRIRFREASIIVMAVTALGVLVGLTAAHRSGIGAWILGVPLALVICTIAFFVSNKFNSERRTAFVVGVAAAGWLLLSLTRIDGIDGSYMPEMSWRWQPTSEEKMLAVIEQADADQVNDDSRREWTQDADGWTGFRGPNRDSRVTAELPELNWNTKPPQEVWRRPVGPAWSSMAVVSGRLFTQEQRGTDETVTCYDAATGYPIWTYTQPSRFEEVVSGAGPRATPEVAGGIVYALGARGILVALDGVDGSLVWKRDLMKDYDSPLPVWGFSASPLVVDGLLIVFVGGADEHGLVAFAADTGQQVWSVSSPKMNYGSAQAVELCGERQVVFVETSAIRGFQISDGAELWRADVVNERDFPMVQPQRIDDSSVIVPTGDGRDVVRIEVTKTDGTWNAASVWESRYLKPSFNDFLYFDGALFGFDKQIFACIDAATGERRWKNGRYGFGQAILLESCGQIIIASEQGELVLLNADSDSHSEQGSVDAMSSKVWNHPAFDSGLLYVRNAEEMICYRL